MNQLKDYYEILGVTKKSDPGVIKNKYRDLAKKYHPDKNPDNPEAEKKFKEINEAYDIIGDPDKRKKYDHLKEGGYRFDGSNPFGGSGGQGFEGDVDINDILSSFFGGGSQSQSGRSPFGGGAQGGRSPFGGGQGGRSPFGQQSAPRSKKGNDQTIKLDVPFDVAAKGGKSNIKLGSSKGFFGSKPRTITIEIPVGVDSGQKIRIPREGDPGLNGGPAGDLYIEVQIKPHPVFSREGIHLICEKTIDLKEALLGTSIAIPTLKNEVSLKVPAGVQPGNQLRVKGQGIQKGSETGDLLVKIQVRLPKKLSSKQIELLEEFASHGLE